VNKKKMYKTLKLVYYVVFYFYMYQPKADFNL